MLSLEKEPTIYEDFYNFFKLREEINTEEQQPSTAGFINASEKYSRFLKIGEKLKRKLGGLETEAFFDIMEEAYNDYRTLEKESNAEIEELRKIKIKCNSLLNTLNKIKETKKEYPKNGETLRILEGELEKIIIEEK